MKRSRLAAVAALALAGGLTLTACSRSTEEAAPTQAASEMATADASAPAAEAPATGMAEDPAMADSAASAGTIVDIAATTEGFSTLVAAATAAGLVETLSGPGPFTVFAVSLQIGDSYRWGLLFIIAFFIIGGLLLTRVRDTVEQPYLRK